MFIIKENTRLYMIFENNDKNHSDDLIIRTKNFKNLPDFENYVQGLQSKGFFKNLIDNGKFTVEEIRKLPISRGCDIFFLNEKQKLETGDIIIFKDIGNFQIYLSPI